MTTHELKCWPTYFKEVIADRKPFEVRKNDRGYEWGDTLLLREWLKSTGYTGRECRFKVTGVYHDLPGLLPDHVVMTIARPELETSAVLPPEERDAIDEMEEDDHNSWLNNR